MVRRVNRLDPARVQQFIREHPEWMVEAGALVRTFELESFKRAMSFVQQVGEQAEKKNHHPDIDVRYTRVTLRWVTHDAGGLTELDAELAAACDVLAR